MTDFRGARGSNAGDDFHELWATRQVIGLLSKEDGLEAVTVEGLSASDEAGVPPDTWDGVDCALYFGGRNVTEADRVQIVQLKYSAANPNKKWTVARLVAGQRRDRSIIARLAKPWKKLTEELKASHAKNPSIPSVVLMSNQPVGEDVHLAMRRAAASPVNVPTRKPTGTAKAEVRLAYAAGLNADDLRAFASALSFEAGTGSRFALEERALRAIDKWTDQDVQPVVTGLRQFVRQRMRPEFAGESITRESVLLHFGTSEEGALFPCPSEIVQTKALVSRAPIREAIERLRSGLQYLCLHGRAGTGKTTALQEIEAGLPPESVMVKYDCYGGGRYLDPSTLRHRTQDAFLQLTNELATRLKLPLLLSRRQDSDYPRLFASRLRHAAQALAAEHPDALIVVAVDAADNSVHAAQQRAPVEVSFVPDFVRLTELPENVRFIVTTRTGRLEHLRLPHSYCRMEIAPFSRQETAENVAQVWAAPESWIEDFHHLSGGIPRVQSYALHEVDSAHPFRALDRLRPAGKSLSDIFRQRFEDAIKKSDVAEVQRLCAGLIALPRPIPLSDMAAVMESTETQLADVCVDLAPGIRLQNGTVNFADEDIEEFVRDEGEIELTDVRKRVAERLLTRASDDRYAALNVAAALVAAERGRDLLNLVEREPAPPAVKDPVLCQEAKLQRLRLAIKVCREAGDVVRALHFVLIGAEGIKTETALRRLLVENPDLAARFAQETAGRLILSDGKHVEDHGPLLFQRLSVDADRSDAVSARAGWRSLNAWLRARELSSENEDRIHQEAWKISLSDVSSTVETALKLGGPEASLAMLRSWKPKSLALEVAFTLPYRLIAEGHESKIEALVTDHLGPPGSLFLMIPLALASRPIDTERMARGLTQLMRWKLRIGRFFELDALGHDQQSIHGKVLDVALTACELLTIERAANDTVDKVLESFLDTEFRRIDRRHDHETFKLDLLFRAYALREARAGRTLTAEGIFEPRPASEKDNSHQKSRHAEEHDRHLRELANVVFNVYDTVANTLVNRPTPSELEDDLRQIRGGPERNSWNISRQHGSHAMFGCAAKHAAILLAAGYAPPTIKHFADKVCGPWRSRNHVLNELLIARLSLWPELHDSLLKDLVTAADEIRTMRVGASEKSGTLVRYARLMKPLSEPDANAIFNYAVEAASELDWEIMAQIRLLGELVNRGGKDFPDARNTARQFSNVVADAAIRLDGYDHFPWSEAMSGLACLDAPLALANAARWDDEGVVGLYGTLAPLLKTALGERTLRPEQAAALALLSDDHGDVIAEVLKQVGQTSHANFPALAEEAAYDVLIRNCSSWRGEIAQSIEQYSHHGPWSDALLRQEEFLANLQPTRTEKPDNGVDPEAKGRYSFDTHVWQREALTESPLLHATIQDLLNRATTATASGYFPIDDIFESARKAVLPKDRSLHLTALAGLEGHSISDGAVRSLLRAIDDWWSASPSVQDWCRTNLPEIIVAQFPEMPRSFGDEEEYLLRTMERAGFSDSEQQSLMLRGIERHVDGLDAERLFNLAGKIGCKLAPSDAAGLADWYVGRLAERIPAGEQDQMVPLDELPRQVDAAVARFLFAYMGDCDLRLRWRAAHAVRRLARTGEDATLVALIAEYDRHEEPAFRGRDVAFYWLAARLWFVVAWDRIAIESPGLASCVARTLLRVALDDSFPHLLVRSFARDACEKLVAAGCLSLTEAESSGLKSVNETPFPPVPAKGIFGSTFADSDEGRRFRFDWLDTLRYWYEPVTRAFAGVDGERFLREVERWIIDVWGYQGNVWDWDKERRRGRFDDRNWMGWGHRHGSIPTLERLSTHLEWHAMWCAAGELLKTERLFSSRADNRHELGDRVGREKLAEAPVWLADFLVPTPLEARNWQPDSEGLDDWASMAGESVHRSAILPSDSPDHVAVSGYSERRSDDRKETISVTSALVEPSTGRFLLRALQTIDDSWAYKLPDEGEDRAEIDEAPYRLLGWLRNGDIREGRIDEKDPFRGYASDIGARPGQRVTVACDLTRDTAGRPRWSSPHAKQPMFAYEVWGEPPEDDGTYMVRFAVAGQRLLVHKEQLLNFLRGQELDLIIEVEVERRGREARRYADEEGNPTPEGRFIRLYRLDGRGGLEVAEGRLGTWAGHRSTA